MIQRRAEKSRADISFCVPVYNVEKYIQACIRSITQEAEGKFEYEIVCIDDCSTDASYKVICELAQRNPKIIALKNECNKGISYTRNRLIDISSGKYIWFVDSDDMLCCGALERLMNSAIDTKGDVILANYIKIDEDDFEGHRDASDYEVERIEARDFEFLKDKKTGGCRMLSCCRGIFRRNYLIEKEIRFNPEVIFREDTLFYYRLLLGEAVWVKCEFSCYCVRQRTNSAMRGGFSGREKQMYSSCVALIDDLSDIKDSLPVIGAAYNKEVEQILSVLLRVRQMSYVWAQIDVLKEKGYINRTKKANRKAVLIGKYILFRLGRKIKGFVKRIVKG